MVNPWTEKSIKLANAPKYLDSLLQVYNMDSNPPRPLPKDIIPQLKEAYEKRQSKRLIQLLLDKAVVFPVKDSYIGFLKAKSAAIDENPKTLARIAQRLYDFKSFDDMRREAERPIETNRQLGNRFKDWLYRLGYPVIKRDEFIASTNGIKILEGGDKTLKDFAKKYLKCKLKKGIDLVIKVNKKYIIGEAKFLTTPGGEQGGGFEDAYTVVSGKSGDAIRIAIIDGYVWLETDSGIYPRIFAANMNIMSSLVLKEFLESI
jgi:hypothetical protein